jgi:nucleotide-binding universal stress UspA family protein
MLDHVLVPLDGSPLAEEALANAIRILHPKGKITLVTVMDLPDVLPHGFYPLFPGSLRSPADEGVWDYQYSVEKMLTQAKTYLTSMVAELKASADVEIAFQAEIGDPATVIVKTAEKLKVDAIVMSTHGRSGLSRWLFGSVTAKVLSAAPCPVFVIPSQRQQHLLEHSTSEVNQG